MIGRFAVPLFFIITGYFSFPMKGDTFCFLKKRLSRIVFPLLSWVIIYSIFLSKPDSIVYDIEYLVQAPQLWYLYALIGITFLIPITSDFISNASKKELALYVAIWCLTLIFNGNYFKEFSAIETNHQGLLFTNPFSALINFYGYFGFLIVGFLFKKYDMGKVTPLILLTIGIIVAGLEIFVFHLEVGEVVAYNSIVNLLISSSIFLAMKAFFEKVSTSDYFYRAVCKVGKLTFGIYLIHWLIFQWLYKIPGVESWNCVLTSVIVFLASLISVSLLSRLPFKQYIIG